MSDYLSYAQVADLLAARHGVEDASRVAFRGRLQHFQRLGFPAGINTGRGRSAKYGFGQVLLLALGLELIEFGLSPEKAVATLNEHEASIRASIKANMKEGKEWNEPTTFWIGFSPSLMSAGFKKPASAPSATGGFFSGGTADLIERIIQMSTNSQTRVALINLSGVLRNIGARWTGYSSVDLEDLQTIVRNWADGGNS